MALLYRRGEESERKSNSIGPSSPVYFREPPLSWPFFLSQSVTLSSCHSSIDCCECEGKGYLLASGLGPAFWKSGEGKREIKDLG